MGGKKEVTAMGAVCFFEVKTSAVCGPHLQASAAEEVAQTSAVCKKKTFLSIAQQFHHITES
ncbi:hypothetical protein LXL04_004092 [Taraxacum kok-saghyz]